jgi:hypothetical protein
LKILKFFFVMGCVAFSSGAASADTLYGDIGAGFPADSPSDYNTAGTFFGTTFTASATGNLGSLEFDAWGTTSPVTVGLYTSAAGEPGTLLESWSATVPTGGGFPPPAATFLTSVLNPLLSSGSAYWIVFSQSSGNQITWFSNDESVAGGIWSGNTLTTMSNVFATFDTPGIELDSAATPEPASAMLLGLGIGGLILAKKMMLSR